MIACIVMFVGSGEGGGKLCSVSFVLLWDPCCLVANVKNEVAARDTIKAGSALHFSVYLELFALKNSCAIFRLFLLL